MEHLWHNSHQDWFIGLLQLLLCISEAMMYTEEKIINYLDLFKAALKGQFDKSFHSLIKINVN